MVLILSAHSTIKTDRMNTPHYYPTPPYIQHTFLPEVWLFARKREQSAPHHLQNYRHRGLSHHAKPGESEEGMVFDHQPPWYRGQGAAIEAAHARAAKLKKVVFRVVGAGFDPRESLASPVPESALMSGEETYFGRTSRLRLRALRR